MCNYLHQGQVGWVGQNITKIIHTKKPMFRYQFINLYKKKNALLLIIYYYVRFVLFKYQKIITCKYEGYSKCYNANDFYESRKSAECRSVYTHKHIPPHQKKKKRKNHRSTLISKVSIQIIANIQYKI